MDFQAGAFEPANDCDFESPDPHERRSEPRHQGLIDCATLFFRGAVYVVSVIDISSRGTKIVSDLEPRLGESVRIQFVGCSPLYAFVRWARDGRIGLNFGCELTIG